jgi:peptidoglycan/LPS O-acetylase OafA/YrhL
MALRAIGFNRYPGRISYGMYVFHITMYWVVFRIFKDELASVTMKLGIKDWKDEAGILAAFLATVVLAVLSYYLLEKPFLRMKKRFTLVPSRD